MTKQIFSATKVIVLAIVLSFGLSYAIAAWTPPTLPPPGANTDAPINIGATPQTKVGGDICTTVSGTTKCVQDAGGADNLGNHTATQALNMASNNISNAGSVTTNTLRVVTGAAASRVLTSDASGNATWQAPAVGAGDNLGNHTATQALNMAGSNITNANNITATGNATATFGPNSTWGAYLDVGGNGRTTTNASVAATNGNLHIDSRNGGYGTYLNYYSGGPIITGGYLDARPNNIYAADVYTTAANTWMSTIANRQIGVGQTWQNVKASRAFGVTYTNTTGRPIFVSLAVFGNNGGSMVTMFVDGIWVGETGGATIPFRDQLSAIVPAGSTYLVVNNSNGTIDAWAELR